MMKKISMLFRQPVRNVEQILICGNRYKVNIIGGLSRVR